VSGILRDIIKRKQGLTLDNSTEKNKHFFVD
jgi:hypothetical protein